MHPLIIFFLEFYRMPVCMCVMLSGLRTLNQSNRAKTPMPHLVELNELPYFNRKSLYIYEPKRKNFCSTNTDDDDILQFSNFTAKTLSSRVYLSFSFFHSLASFSLSLQHIHLSFMAPFLWVGFPFLFDVRSI